MKLTGRMALRIFYASLTTFTAAIVSFVVFRPIKVLPRSTVSPGFSFTDASGHPVTSESLRGHMVLYSFANATCLGACAMHQDAMRDAYRQLTAQNRVKAENDPPIAFVTVRVDGRTGGAAPTSGTHTGRDWHVLTGDAESMKRVVGAGFGVYYDENSVEPAIVLVDGWGIRRAEYRAPRPDPEIISRDLELLLDEARNSTGVARYAYEAAHLFLCYPT